MIKITSFRQTFYITNYRLVVLSEYKSSVSKNISIVYSISIVVSNVDLILDF